MTPPLWHYRAAGAGRPLVLLHGIGMSHAVWDPVLPYLWPTRHVVAFDLPGFGRTPPLPPGTPPTIANLAIALEHAVASIGLTTPFDVAGNSLGGAVAIEAAARGLARSVVALAPAGLWRRHDAWHVPLVFGTLRAGARHALPLLKRLMGPAWLRELLLAVPLSVGSRRMPVEAARRTLEDLAGAVAFEDTFAHTRAPFIARGITSPVTVAFGTRDWILTPQSRRRDALPAHTRWVAPVWGHVPMWVDPAGVARLILDGTGQDDLSTHTRHP